jgi:sporulation protein YlmC with PRC-barrel domain
VVQASTTMAACAAFLAATALVAGAQTSTDSRPRLDTHVEIGRAAQPEQIQGDEIRASKILGSAIYTDRNTKIGKVTELIIDQDGHVAAVIVEITFVGMGEKSVAVSLGDITVSDNHLILDRTVDQLQQMASYKLESDNEGAAPPSPNLAGHLTPVPAR